MTQYRVTTTSAPTATLRPAEESQALRALASRGAAPDVMRAALARASRAVVAAAREDLQRAGYGELLEEAGR